MTGRKVRSLGREAHPRALQVDYRAAASRCHRLGEVVLPPPVADRPSESAAFMLATSSTRGNVSVLLPGQPANLLVFELSDEDDDNDDDSAEADAEDDMEA